MKNVVFEPKSLILCDTVFTEYLQFYRLATRKLLNIREIKSILHPNPTLLTALVMRGYYTYIPTGTGVLHVWSKSAIFVSRVPASFAPHPKTPKTPYATKRK